jgi:hypothetical protein
MRQDSKTHRRLSFDLGDNQYMGYTVKMEPDQEPANPRQEFDHFGTLVCWHPKYKLGDFNGPDWHEMPDAPVVMPVYLYDHSGLRMKTYPFYDPWDSGQVGWIYASRDDIISEYGEVSDEAVEKVKQLLIGEIEEMDQYLAGEVYCIAIKAEDGELLDSVCGVFGYEYACDLAKQMVHEQAEREAYERL